MSQTIYSNIPANNQYPYLQQQQMNPNFTASGTPVSSGANVLEKNPLLNAASSTPDNPLSFLAAAGVSTAVLFAINNFINNSLQTKEYDSTFFKKIEECFDGVSSNKIVSKITNTIGNIKNTALQKAEKSEILRTMLKKPSIGGPMVQSQAAGAKGHLANRALEIMKKYKETTGYTGFDSIIQRAGKESYKYYDDIIRTINNSGADLTKVISKRPWWGLGIVQNKSSLKEILNKAKLIENYKTPGASLGKKVSGYLLRGTECLTNGIFSGKGQVLFQALIIAQSINEASKAEKGEKFSTFMASLAELMAFLATMGIQMRIVNSLAGLKNIGMSETSYNRLKVAMEAANNAAKAGDAATYNAQKAIIKQIKNAAKANTNWYQKPFKWLGNVISFGRIKETIKPLNNKTVGSFLKKIPYGLKVGAGYVGRIALIMGVVVPIFSGIAKKMSYAIFGKPTKTLAREKAKEEAERSEEQMQMQSQPVETANPTGQQMRPQSQQQQVQQTAKPGDLIEKMNNNYNNAIGAQSMSQSVPASTPINKSPEENAGIKRSYIPNAYLGIENPVNPASSRTAQIEAVLRQADRAEAQARALGV